MQKYAIISIMRIPHAKNEVDSKNRCQLGENLANKNPSLLAKL